MLVFILHAGIPKMTSFAKSETVFVAALQNLRKNGFSFLSGFRIQRNTTTIFEFLLWR